LEKCEKIDTKKLPFIIDDIVEIEESSFKFSIENSVAETFKFKEGTLILLEVKNRFPDDLEKEIYITLNKTMNFYQLYEERYKIIKNVRVMFFYDAIPKKSYDKALEKILNNFFKHKVEMSKKIQFQFVFITSSYLAFNFKNLKDKIDDLENEVKDLKEILASNVKNLEKKIDSLSKIESEIAILKNENLALKEKLINQQENTEKTKINGKNSKHKK